MLELFFLAVGTMGLVFLALSLVFGHRLGDNGEKMGWWRDCMARLATRQDDLPSYSIADFRSQIAEGKKWSVLADFVIDLRRLRSHPGGEFLHRFEGRDMTPWFLTTHCKQQRPLRLFRSMVVGKLADGQKRHPLLPELDREHMRMFESYTEKGLFANRNEWVLWDVGEVMLGIGFGMYFVHYTSLSWLGYLLVFFGAIRQGFLAHDVGHRSMFKDFNLMETVVCYTSLIIWGFEFTGPIATHDQHHAFVNVIGMDGALELGPVKVHRKTDNPKETHMGVLQNFLFYGLVVWLLLPAYVIRDDVIHNFSLSDPWYYVKIFRLALTIYYWDLLSPMVYGAILFTLVFAVFGSLNHFHMPMKENEQFLTGENYSFVKSQVESIQNTTSSRFYDWAMDHFTLHTEHHLFPYMPRRIYNKISTDVQALLAKYEVPYNTCSVPEAFRRLNTKMMNPF